MKIVIVLIGSVLLTRFLHKLIEQEARINGQEHIEQQPSDAEVPLNEGRADYRAYY